METIIGLKEANCKNCCKCIRSCPVKSIEYRNDKVQILTDDCIFCGNCLLECPQNAKYVSSDLPKVRRAIQNGDKLYVSLAPSFIAAFPDTGILKMSAALKKIGFAHVEETAVGAAQVTKEYERLISERKMKNIISTACPSINLLVEKYYPELVPQLAPVVTPAVAHARMMKQVYGNRIKVVFIGPCVSKKYEPIDTENGNAIFAVLTFNELNEFFQQEEVDFSDTDINGRTLINQISRCFPVPGGIIRNLSREERRIYECISIDGADRCREILDSILKDNLTGYFLELSICPGSCLGGPSLKLMGKSFLTAKNNVFKNLRISSPAPAVLTEGIKAQFGKNFKNKSSKKKAVSEEEIKQVLNAMGKTSVSKELNCGCCGYNTCREKAKAVVRGKADIHMCVPYMRELAESMSNTVVENTPTGIIILDDKLNIIQINPAAYKMLKINETVIEKSIITVLKSDDFFKAMSEKNNILNHKVYYEDHDMFVEQTVVWVEDNRHLFILIKDITNEEKADQKRRKFAEDSANFAREVVNRQMKAVQDIADLLGQTTVDTQTAFSKLTSTLVKDDSKAKSVE